MGRHLEITTYIGCPNMCSYCPQKLLIDTYKGDKRMTVETLRKILDNVPTDVDIHFSGFSELFFHKDCVEMLKEAMKTHQVIVYTTTMGMTDEVYEQIKDLHFKEFHVHSREGSRIIPFATDKISITTDNAISRGGNLWETKSEGTHCKKSSSYEQNVVLPNGDVVLCCMDYGLKHKIGNLLETNFNDLVRQEKYDLCKTCEWYV